MSTPMNLSDLARCLIKSLVVIDYDGCILTDQIHESFAKGFEYHAITPFFAHPFFIEKLYNLTTTDLLSCAKQTSRIDLVEGIRYTTIDKGLRNILRHKCYNERIFKKPYEDVFIVDADGDLLVALLMFADYYTLAMSFLYKKILIMESSKIDEETAKNLIDAVTSLIIDRLTTIAEQLGLINQQSPQQMDGGTKPSEKEKSPPKKMLDSLAKKFGGTQPKLGYDVYHMGKVYTERVEVPPEVGTLEDLRSGDLTEIERLIKEREDNKRVVKGPASPKGVQALNVGRF
jgi:hypothetical protein